MPASRYRFHPAAEVELQEASDWYEDRRSGLGLDFLEAVRRKIFEVLETRNSGVNSGVRVASWLADFPTRLSIVR